MGFFSSDVSPEEREQQRIEEALTKYNIFEGIECEVILPEKQLKTSGSSGAKKGTTVETCSMCNGVGKVKQVISTPLGRAVSERLCTACGGEGKIIKEPCPDCKGKGIVKKQIKIKVKIPEGIDEGQTVVLKGEGEAGVKGGPKGDLYIG
jgi:molecular chaperone DnaJ